MIGASENETFLLFLLPAGISLLLFVFLLFTWRKIRSLVGAVLALCVYGTAASLAHSAIGLLMLLLMGWVAALFLALALWISTRPLDVAPSVRPDESGKTGARRTGASPVVRVLFGALLALLGCVAALVALESFVWSLNAVGWRRVVPLPLCLFSSLLVVACVWCLWRIRAIAVSKLAQMLFVSLSLLFLAYTMTVRW